MLTTLFPPSDGNASDANSVHAKAAHVNSVHAKSIRSLRSGDDDGFESEADHDIVRLLDENARLRKLVTQLSALVLKHVTDTN